MARPKKVEVEFDMYEGFSEKELKDVIVRNLREIKRLQKDLKDYAKGTKETVGELEARNDAALDTLDEIKLGLGAEPVSLPTASDG